MQVTVKLFARARDLAGADQIVIDLPASGRVRDLKRILGAKFPQMAPLIPDLLVAVGNEYASADAIVSPQADVASFPPVSGG